MALNCRVNINSNGEVTSINAPNGAVSKLYTNLKKIFGEKAKQVYAITETEGFKNFANNLRFAASRPQTQPPEDSQKQTAKLVTEYLKSKGQNINILSEEDMLAEAKKRGYENFNAMVKAYHGSPYKFDKFSTQNIGTGEGAQAFGWGLYFTDLESIARNYADNESLLERHLRKKYRDEMGIPDRYYQIPQGVRQNKKNTLNFINNTIEGWEGVNPTQVKEWTKLKDAVEDFNVNVYEVSLFKDKTPIKSSNFEVLGKMIVPKRPLGMSKDEYFLKARNDEIKPLKAFNSNKEAKDWLESEDGLSDYYFIEWDKSKTDYINILKNYTKKLKEKYPKSSEFFDAKFKEFRESAKDLDGKTFYEGLLLNTYRIGKAGASYKDVSLLLNEIGVDGIKYPAESIARGATSDTARGFNYVVFDENAVTIEQNIQFLNQGDQIYGFYDTNTGEIYLTEELLSSENLVHEMWHSFSPVLKQKAEQGDQTAKEVLNQMESISFKDILGGEQAIKDRFEQQKTDNTPLSFSATSKWVSNALKGLSPIKQKSATPEQWVQMIAKQGGKGTTQELEWIGLQDYLNEYITENNTKSVPKEVVEQYINDNQIEIVEVLKSDMIYDNYEAELEEAENRYIETNFEKNDGGSIRKYYTVIDIENSDKVVYIGKTMEDVSKESSKLGEDYTIMTQELPYNIKSVEEYNKFQFPENDEINSIKENKPDFDKIEPRHSEYQLEGGDKYREVLLTIPKSTLNKEYFKQKEIVSSLNNILFEEAKKEGIEEQHTWDIKKFLEPIVNIKKNYPDIYKRDDFNGYENTIRALINYEKEHNKLNKLLDSKSDDYYNKTHWDEANVLAFVRMNERTLPNGERTLFVEEVQSDWAQEGRKRGFEGNKAGLVYIKSTFGFQISVDGKTREPLYIEFTGEGNVKVEDDLGVLPESETYHNTLEEAKEYIEKNFSEKKYKQERPNFKKSLPNMPYKKTDQWVGMASRRIMQMAAQEGFDRVTWVTGEQSADRYDLSKQVKLIRAIEYSDGNWGLIGEDKSGSSFDIATNIKASEIESYVGKDLANKIVEKEDGDDMLDEVGEEEGYLSDRVYSGQDLKVGGEGMKTFYNSIVPKVIKKEAQRFDKKANVDVVEVPLEESYFNPLTNKLKSKAGFTPETSKQLSLKITPKMRENLSQGIPLFMTNQLSSEVYNPREGETYEQYRDRMIDEASALLMQKNSVQFFERIAKENGLNEAETKSFIQKVKDFIRSFSEWLTQQLGLENTSPEEIANLTQRELFDRITTSMLRQPQENIQLKYNSKGQHLAPNGKPSNLTESQAKQVRTKAFKNWFGDWENDPQNASKVVDENGEPLVVYHGTSTPNLIEFETRREGTFFTDNIKTARGYANDIFPETIGVFLNIKNPTINTNSRYWDKIFNEPVNYIDIRYMVDEVVEEDTPIEVSKNGAEPQYFKIKELLKDIEKNPKEYPYNIKEEIENDIRLFKEEGEEKFTQFNQYFTENETNISPTTTDIFNINVFRDTTSDGIIFKNISDDTYKTQTISNIFVTKNPNQIKSATENIGTFDPNNNDIRFQTNNTENGLRKQETQGVIREGSEGNRVEKELKVLIGGYDKAVERNNPIENRDRLKRESVLIEQWAKDSNYLIEDIETKFTPTELGGAESEIFLDKNDANVIIKEMNPGAYNGYAGVLGRLALHKKFFPETAYEVIGFTKEGDVLNIVLKQNFVKNARNATQQEIFEYLNDLEFEIEGSVSNTYVWKNNKGVTVGDMHEGNALVTDNGVVVIIDPMIEYEGELSLEEYLNQNLSPQIQEMTFGDTVIKYSKAGNKLNLEEINTPAEKRGKGSARKALKQFLAITDKKNLIVKLIVKPTQKGVDESKLKEFYQSEGFEFDSMFGFPSDFEMIRYPQNKRPQEQKEREIPEIQPEYFDENGEVKVEVLAEYATNKSVELSNEEKQMAQNMAMIFGVTDIESLHKKLRQNFENRGFIVFERNRMEDLSEAEKDFAIENKEQIERIILGSSSVEVQDYNSAFVFRGSQPFFVENPYLVEKEIKNLVAGSENPRQVLPDEYKYIYDSNQEFKQAVDDLANNYVKAKVFVATENSLTEKPETDTEELLTETVNFSNTSKLNNQLTRLFSYSEATLRVNEDELYDIAKDIEKQAVNTGIDLEGLAENTVTKNIEDTLGYLTSLRDFIDSSGSTMKSFVSAHNNYFDIPTSPKQEVVLSKDANDVLVETDLSETILYEKYGLIRSKGNQFKNVNKEPLEALYVKFMTNDIKLDKDFEDIDDLIEYVQEKVGENETAEAIFLFKKYFGIQDLQTTENVENNLRNFDGDFNKLSTDFISDFYINKLKNKGDKFYSHFTVTKNGIVLKSTDPLTVQEVVENIPENIKKDFTNYTLISQNLSLPLQIEQNPAKDISNLEIKRIEAAVFTEALPEVFNYQREGNVIITATNPNTFVKVGEKPYELVREIGDKNVYVEMPKSKKGFTPLTLYKAKYKETVDLQDLNYLVNKPTEYVTKENIYSKQELDKINQQNFDC